jgi:hypothetical protein
VTIVDLVADGQYQGSLGGSSAATIHIESQHRNASDRVPRDIRRSTVSPHYATLISDTIS